MFGVIPVQVLPNRVPDRYQGLRHGRRSDSHETLARSRRGAYVVGSEVEESSSLKGQYPTRTPVAFPAGSIKHSFQQGLNGEELLIPKLSSSLFGYNPLSLREERDSQVTFFTSNVG